VFDPVATALGSVLPAVLKLTHHQAALSEWQF